MNAPALNISLGKHYIVEYYGCAVEALNSPERLETLFLDAARQSGATIIDSSFRKFDPQGISGVVVIAESHFTVHTWPEFRYAAVDIFTCGSSIAFDTAMRVIEEGLEADEQIITGKFDRGILGRNGSVTRTEGFSHTHEMATPITGSARSWKEKFEREDGWGLLTSLDIHDCNPEIIRDADAIKRFAVELCDHIEMKRFGDTVVVNFGEDERVAGFSLVQLIETSLISGHFANLTNNSYIDIFSCKFYEPHEAANFCMKFFQGRDYTMNVAVRK